MQPKTIDHMRAIAQEDPLIAAHLRSYDAGQYPDLDTMLITCIADQRERYFYLMRPHLQKIAQEKPE